MKSPWHLTLRQFARQAVGALALALGAVAVAAPADLPETCYLYSYFYHHDEAGGLRLAWSRDGYTFEALNGTRSYLKPAVGENKIMRDPCLLLGPDNRWITAQRIEISGGQNI